MCITPMSPAAHRAAGRVTWVNSQWKLCRYLGHFRMEIYTLIGAFFLSAVDDALDKTGLFYIRFMDDILVLAPSRWKLRHAVRTVNQALASLAVEKHPDKTFIGRIERGFDFLGYHFSRVGLTIARKTIANFITKASRLYEQKRSTVLADAALEMYVKRWARWAKSGLEAKMSAGKWCLPTETRCPAILKRST